MKLASDWSSLADELESVLRHRLALVVNHELRERDPQTQLKELREATARLNKLIERLPAGCDPMLRHYLERQSYVKALDWLKNRPKTAL